MSVYEMRDLYTELDYDTIPLIENSKLPLVSKWQERSPFVQWKNAPEDANLGVRAGHGKAMLDCDDKKKQGTSETVINWLEGLGYDRETLPIVRTASGIGRHVYVNFAGAMLGSRKNLISQIGAGDFRYGQAAFVVGVSSVVDGNEYRLVSGDFANLPTIDLKDIAAIVDINSVAAEVKKPRASRLAVALMAGEKLAKYKSKSEAEAALMLSLINSGLTFEEIRQIFNTNPCAGHYSKYGTEKEKGAYLFMTYQNMLDYSKKESPTRRLIAELIARAKVVEWKKVTDKNLLLAGLGIAYNAGSLEFSASVRDLSLHAGVSISTASLGNKRLLKSGLLTVAKPGTLVSATTYQVQKDKIEHFLSTSNCEEVFENVPQKDPCVNALDDAFMNGKNRLGRRAGEVYELIYGNPLTVSEIAKRTGASEKTVRRALRKMAMVKDYRTGEIIEMVTQDGGKWFSNLVSMDTISAIMNTHGATGRRAEEYAKERRDHLRTLELGKPCA